MLSQLVLCAVILLFNVLFCDTSRYNTQPDASGVPNRNELLFPYMRTDAQRRASYEVQYHSNPTGGGSFYCAHLSLQPFYQQQSGASSRGHAMENPQEGTNQGGYHLNRAASGESFNGPYTSPHLFHQESRDASRGHHIGHWQGGTYNGGYQLNQAAGGERFNGPYTSPHLFHQESRAASRGHHIGHWQGGSYNGGYQLNPAAGVQAQPQLFHQQCGAINRGATAATPAVASNDFTRRMPYGGVPIVSRHGAPSAYAHPDRTDRFREQTIELQYPSQSFADTHEQPPRNHQQFSTASATHLNHSPQERSIQPHYLKEPPTEAASLFSGDAQELSPQVDTGRSGTSIQVMMNDYIGSGGIDKNAFDDVVLPSMAPTSSASATSMHPGTHNNPQQQAAEYTTSRRYKTSNGGTRHRFRNNSVYLASEIIKLLQKKDTRIVEWIDKPRGIFKIKSRLALASFLGQNLVSIKNALWEQTYTHVSTKEQKPFLKTTQDEKYLAEGYYRFGSDFPLNLNVLNTHLLYIL